MCSRNARRLAKSSIRLLRTTWPSAFSVGGGSPNDRRRAALVAAAVQAAIEALQRGQASGRRLEEAAGITERRSGAAFPRNDSWTGASAQPVPAVTTARALTQLASKACRANF